MKTNFGVPILTVLALLIFSFNTRAQQLTLTASDFNGFNISCFGGNNGSIDMTITGGTPPFVISWSNSETTEDISNLPAGYYRVTVDDADTLTPPSEAEITLIEPRRIDVSYQAYQFPNGFNISVFGACNGSIDVSVTDGVSPYTYSWKDGPTTQDRSLVCASTYKVIVTDLNGCIAFSDNIIMKEPERGDWQLGGNNSLDPTTQFIGTTDNSDLSFRTNNVETFRLKSDGKINIGSFSGSTPNLVYSDSLGTLHKIPFYPPNQSCAGSITTPWQQSPYHWEDVFSCYRRFGIGTDQPREKLEVKGSMIVSAWDVSMNNMSDYIQLKHDGGNARIENFGTGDLLINPGNSKNVKIGTEPGGGYFQTGFDTYLSTNGGKVGIGTISPEEDFQIGDIFTFHNGTSKVIGYNYKYDDLNNQAYRIDLNKPVSFLSFNEDGGIQFQAGWCLSGNSLVSNYIESLSINHRGYVGIGGPPEDGYDQDDPLLIVCGKIKAKEFELRTGWCDFVFDDDYNRMDFEELEMFLKINKHLPYIKSGRIIETEGLRVGETMQGFVQNLEETRLDVIDLYKMIKELKSENDILKAEIETLKNK